MRIKEKFLPGVVTFDANGNDTGKRYSYSDRRPGAEIDLIILHSIAEYMIVNDTPQEWFAYLANPKHNASYHYVVLPYDDEPVLNIVPVHRRAWHAGISEFRGRRNLNHTSIGMAFVLPVTGYGEFMEAMNKPESFTDEAYKKMAFACRVCMEMYPDITADNITEHRIVSHSGIRDDPKHDPGDGFDMYRLLNEIEGLQAAAI